MTSIRFVTGKSSGILSDISFGVLSDVSSGILSGRWGPAVLTELGSEGPRLRSSGAHWARRVPGWGPAVLTELGRSQVEVQRCPVRSDPGSWGPAVLTELGESQVEVQRCSLSSESPRLRSSSAHWALKVPGWGPAVPSALRPWQLRSSSAHCVRKLAKSLAKSWQGGGEDGSECKGGGGEAGGEGGGGEGGGGWGGGGGGGEQLYIIKSNNPHLAGGEYIYISWYIHMSKIKSHTGIDRTWIYRIYIVMYILFFLICYIYIYLYWTCNLLFTSGLSHQDEPRVGALHQGQGGSFRADFFARGGSQTAKRDGNTICIV